jgi:RHS repeat-associated protein
LEQDSDPKDLFAFKINYDKVEADPNYAIKLYNGNIAETAWTTGSDFTGVIRRYGYLYDKLNRLQDATYQTPTLADNKNYFGENMDYDKNGNIIRLERMYMAGVLSNPYADAMDKLGYFYKDNSNQLMKVTDTSNQSQGFKDDSSGFNDSTDDYDYDNNGNLIKDENKNITKIEYNYLNLPKKITFGTSGTIEYIYNAAGQKLEKIVTEGATVTNTNYLGGFQYKDNLLQFFPTAEGYVKNEAGVLSDVFQYKDHLGNVRVSYAKNPQTQVLEIIEENNYYPFGLKHNGYNDYLPITNKYKYNGKELQDELGLNMTAMDYRQYDSAIGRFVGMDRLSEFTHSITPYRFALNNPIYFNDPSGLSEFENKNEGLTICPTCPNTPEFKPLIDDPNNIYVYDAETNTATQAVQLDEVVVQGESKSSANLSTDYHDISMLFRKYSGYAMTIQKPLGIAFEQGTRYASQLYPGNTSNVIYKTLGGRIQVPLGNYNTATIGKISKTLKITGRTLGVVAVVAGGVSIYNDGLNISNGLDTSMALLALSPTGVGQAIAGTYFLCNSISQLTTGKDIGQHIQEQIDGE